jgi:hypothetical protein
MALMADGTMVDGKIIFLNDLSVPSKPNKFD